MADHPLTQGAAPRFDSTVAIWRYTMLLGCFAAGLCGASILNPSRPQTAVFPPKRERVRSLQRFAAVIAAIAVILIAFLNRHLVLSPHLIIDSLQSGLAHYASAVQKQDNGGIATLLNLFSVPVAIWSALYFHPLSSTAVRRSALRGLVFLGAVIFVVAFLNAARMWLVQFAMITVGSYSIYRRVNWKLLCLVVAIMVCCAWMAELTRWGVWYQNASGTPLFSLEMQEMIGRRLVEGYVAADLNNAFILLDDDPSMKLMSSAVSLRRLLSACGLVEADFASGGFGEEVANWTSIFGAVNAVGLLWYDLGWLAGVILAWLGFVLALCFAQAVHSRMEVGNGMLIYLICFPGLFAMTRINYYSLSIFLIPFMALVGRTLYDAVTSRPA